MDQKNNEKKSQREIRQGYVYLAVFLILIFAGIFVKRAMGHPEFMMVFHGPAAIFLVVGGLKISHKHRQKFKNVVIKD